MGAHRVKLQSVFGRTIAELGSTELNLPRSYFVIVNLNVTSVYRNQAKPSSQPAGLVTHVTRVTPLQNDWRYYFPLSTERLKYKHMTF